MSADPRLRQGLERNASTIDPDIDRSLDVVVGRARRRTRMRRAGAVLAATVVALVILVAGPGILDVLRERNGRIVGGTPTPTVPPGGQVLTGTYSIRVQPTPSTTEHDMQGPWTIRFTSEGSMEVDPPGGFAGVVSGALFDTEGDTFRTGLLGQDVCSFDPLGAYRWRRSGDALTFEVVDDPCEARVQLFASGSWTRVR